jgi:hypothetical protein
MPDAGYCASGGILQTFSPMAVLKTKADDEMLDEGIASA